MNFKILLLLFFLSSCGVKGDPVAPKNRPLPSFLDNYPDIETEQTIHEYRKR